MKFFPAMLIGMLIVITPALADDMQMSGHMTMHHGMHAAGDERISLGLSPQMKQQQLAMMRSHLQAVQRIVGLMAEGRFDEASGIAHAELGLTPEMKAMCNSFANADFRSLGLAFHNSADVLGDTLKTGDMQRSLEALHATMNSCVQCHATFRQ